LILPRVQIRRSKRRSRRSSLCSARVATPHAAENLTPARERSTGRWTRRGRFPSSSKRTQSSQPSDWRRGRWQPRFQAPQSTFPQSTSAVRISPRELA